MENSKIEWTHHTFNMVWGCQKVSEGCKFCYAESLSNRYGKHLWGPNAERQVMSDDYWRQPLKWNKKAEGAAERPRVFCSSMADVFEDHPTNNEQRIRLFDLIRQTPNLDWLLLTKRPENIWRLKNDAAHSALMSDNMDLYSWFCHWHHGRPPENVWLGTSVENQEAADKRIPELLKIPARVRFLSCEPLLGPVDLDFNYFDGKGPCTHWLKGKIDRVIGDFAPHSGISWVICGGESGPNARPMHPDWARGLRDQCTTAGVAFHFKQWGEWAPVKDELRSYRQQIIGGNPDHVRAIARMAKAHGATEIFTPCGKFPFDVDHIEYGFLEHLARVGKKAAGRLLDGRTWNEVPDGSKLAESPNLEVER